ncbi:MAG: outer membrane lipoprotein-sorting protein [Zetaproteobacteria bacterium]|nr:MAG: outer membrane lipoprotein-sorting protein [Zetaproteobacteria bacterium]
MRAERSIARYTMRIETAQWRRTLRFDAWDDRSGHRFFIRVLAPRKERDTTWLKDGANLWMYLPRLERDIRIPPSMMRSSWMGSDFTNDDLVKMDAIVRDYRHRIIGDDGAIYTVESTARPDAPVVWGRIVHRIGHDGLPRTDDYYDEHGRHIRTITFDRVRTMDGRRIPTRWVVQPSATPGRRTVMLLERITFDPPIPARIFSRANLRRAGR